MGGGAAMLKPRAVTWTVLMTLTVVLIAAPAGHAATSVPGGPAQASADSSPQVTTSRANSTDGGVGAVAASPDPTMAVGDVVVHEGDTNTRAAVFTVSLSQPSAVTVTVAYATANGTATQPADYRPRSGTLTFTVGQVSKTVSVPVRGDTAVEGDETFTLNLSSLSGAALGDGTGTATIRDDDPGTGLRLAVGDVVVHEGDTSTRAKRFTVSLSRPAAVTVTVAYATANGTATQPADYARRSGTLTFSVGQVSKTVSVPVKGDIAVEGNETFTLNLSNVTGGATITDGSGLGTIADDDAVSCPPSITFGQTATGCSLPPGGQTDFTFSGSAGQVLRARAVRTSGAGNLNVLIYNSNRALRCSSGASGDAIINQCTVDTAQGTVRVVNTGTDTVGYDLFVQRVDSPLGCAAPGYGATTPGSIDLPGEHDCFRFSGSPGQVLRARVVRTSGTGNLNVLIYNSNGALRCSSGASPNPTILQCTVDTADVNVFVFSPGTGTAGYDLTVERLS